MRRHSLHRYIAGFFVAVATHFATLALAEPFSIETPFPQLAELVSQKKLTADELTEILVDGVAELGDLPPDFTVRPVSDPEFYTVLGKALVKKTTEILSTQSSTKTIGLKKLANALLPESDSSRKNIAQLVTLAERIEHLEAVENAVDLVGLRPEVRQGLERELLEERASRLLTRLAKKSFDAKQGDQTIKLLAQIEPQWRDDEALKLGSKALVLYKESYSRNAVEWIFDVAENRKFLEVILEKDPGSKSTAAELFSIYTLQLVAAGNAEGAAIAFDKAVKERPDPDAKNDKLRLEIINTAKLPSVQGFAKGRMMDLEYSGGLGVWVKFKLLMSGFYGSLYPLVIFGCFSMIIFFAVLSRFKPDFVLTVPRLSVSLPRITKRKKKAVSGYRNLASTPDEYSRLLAQFNLDDSATEEDIRKAYRQKMKDLHPDASSEIENTDSFIDVKQAYERILEIQRTRFSKS